MPELIPSQSHFSSKMAFSLIHGDRMTSCDLSRKRPPVAPFPLPSVWTSQMGDVTSLGVLLSPASLREMDLKK